jgi:hypothetical protein
MLDPPGLPSVEVHRPARVTLGKVLIKFLSNATDELALPEQMEARPPTVVGRAGRIESEDLGSFADERGGMGHPSDNRCHDISVKALGQLQTRQEVRHGA